jgi:hypothetical protein
MSHPECRRLMTSGKPCEPRLFYSLLATPDSLLSPPHLPHALQNDLAVVIHAVGLAL